MPSKNNHLYQKLFPSLVKWQMINKPQTIWASKLNTRIEDNSNTNKCTSKSLSRLNWRNIKNRNNPSERIFTQCGLPSACHQPLELVFYRATKTTLLHKYTTVTCLPIVYYSRETKYSHDTVVMYVVRSGGCRRFWNWL